MLKTEVETLYCSCGKECEDKIELMTHQSRQNNPKSHQLEKVPPKADPCMMMFDLWAYQRTVTSAAADMLIHASLHIHLTDVIYFGGQPIERLSMRHEYKRRELLEMIFPFLVLYTKEAKYPPDHKKLFDMLYAEPALEDISEDDLHEVIVEWRRRHAE